MSYSTNQKSTEIIGYLLDTAGVKVDCKLMNVFQQIHQKAVSLHQMKHIIIPRWTKEGKTTNFEATGQKSDFDLIMIIWIYTMHLIKSDITIGYLQKSLIRSLSHYNFDKLNKFIFTLQTPLQFKEQYGTHLTSANIKTMKKFIVLCLELKQSKLEHYKNYDFIQKIILSAMAHVKSYLITKKQHSWSSVNTDIQLFSPANNIFPDEAVMKCFSLGYSEQQIATCIDYMQSNEFIFESNDIVQNMRQFQRAMNIL
eukprot:98324_1